MSINQTINMYIYKVNNHSQPLSLPQSSENSGDIKAPETKSDDERNQLANKHLPLADNISAAESVGSQDMDDTNGTQPRLSLIKSKHDENNQPADYTDSSEEEEINSGDEQAVDSPDSPVHHPRTQESVEIDRLMKRKFSTRGPAFNNHSTVLEDPDLVIVVGYSDSDEETITRVIFSFFLGMLKFFFVFFYCFFAHVQFSFEKIFNLYSNRCCFKILC
ncbi:hypothetical protein RFI_34527 [Reticulomyxa filosa]|uniref:Uncharacterized protein n=1 Tax=Reticulomyxa filosa TaxID=46433 RepID=X6LNG3_RETFI|nr:hypothetical protein RFI_34527 [Reticulomyxa filosa]|eukprot:ETO02886.1 hypothetical protein RFI_34527 [Reticulomyxa filosa]